MYLCRLSFITKAAAILLAVLATAGGTARAADVLPPTASPGCACEQCAPVQCYLAVPCERHHWCDHLFSRLCCEPRVYAARPCTCEVQPCCQPVVKHHHCGHQCAPAPTCCTQQPCCECAPVKHHCWCHHQCHAAPACCTPQPCCQPTCNTCAPAAPCCNQCTAAPACCTKCFILKATLQPCQLKPQCCCPKACAPCGPCSQTSSCAAPGPISTCGAYHQTSTEPALANDSPAAYGPGFSQGQGAAGQLNGLAVMRETQQEDIKAFQQLLERRIANMEAIREMQQADVDALGSLESLLHQARGAMTPTTPNSAPAVRPAAAPIPNNVRTQLDSLGESIEELNRTVQLLNDREAAHSRRAAR